MNVLANAALRDLVDAIDASRRRRPSVSTLVETVADHLGTFTRSGEALEGLDCVPRGDGYTQHVLHVAPDRGFSVVALIWGPGHHTSIHDHRGWCVVGVQRGRERETRYRLERNCGVERLHERETSEIGAGDVIALLPGQSGIHRVANSARETTVSLHVYGTDVERYGTSIARRFDDLPIVA